MAADPDMPAVPGRYFVDARPRGGEIDFRYTEIDFRTGPIFGALELIFLEKNW